MAASRTDRSSSAPSQAPSQARGKRSLVKAAKDGNLELMDELLNEGANLEDLGMWDNTPLLVACTYGHTEAALRLIALKADISAKNEHGATPLHYAAVEGSLRVVESLIAAATASGDAAGASKLVNCGDACVYNRHLDTYARRTPLGSAAECGFQDVAGVLMASGAQIEVADDEGRTPLWLACRHSRTGVARFLMQHGADTGIKDSQGTSVLGAAMVNCNEELVRALLTHGVGNVNDTASSPLRDAIKAGKRGAFEALLTHGAAVNVAGDLGVTPLHAACEKGDEYLVSLLVRAHADPSTEDSSGRTAFDLLRRRGLSDGHIASLLQPAAGGEEGSTGGACVGAGVPE